MTIASAADDLDAMLERAWQLLRRAAVDRRAALHQPVVANIGRDGPSARVMVLRGVDRRTATLRFHTDVRSGKVGELAVDPRVTVTGYDAGAKLQLRLRGRGQVATGAAVDAIWATIDPFGRRAYRTRSAPGTPQPAATADLPPEFEQPHADDAPSDAGQANFAVLSVEIDSLEWLLLAAAGHRRAQYDRDGDMWRGRWLTP